MNWKSLIKFVVGSILSFTVIVGLGVLLIPEKVVITQQLKVAATEEQLTMYFNDLQHWPKILPWLSSDTAKKTEFTLKKGKCFYWQYENSDEYQGVLCLLEASGKNKVAVEISFKGHSSLFHELSFKKIDAIHTEIIWTGSSEKAKGLKKWEYVFIKQWLKHDIGIALQDLPQQLAETGFLTQNIGNCIQYKSEDTYFVYKIETIDSSIVEKYLTKTWNAIRADVNAKGLNSYQFPYCILRKSGEPETIAVEAGIILKPGKSRYEGHYSERLVPGDSMLNIEFKGEFFNYTQAVDSLEKASKSLNFELNEDVILTYKDSSETITNISSKVPYFVSIHLK
jgi:hypothetical protein